MRSPLERGQGCVILICLKPDYYECPCQKTPDQTQHKLVVLQCSVGLHELVATLADGVIEHTDIAGNVNGILFFSTKRAQLIGQLEILTPVIKADTVVWVCYPKKSSGIDTDLAMMQWDMLPAFGLDAVANAAFDDKWTCVRLRLIGQRKKTGVGIDEIKNNEYGRYIDVDKKVITLPPDVQEALQAEPAAFAVYEKLAYSHRKEYIMWILGAKQQKTRDARLIKMVEMLLANKKNPGEK